ncbi:hypothetical protein [Fulvivirga lutea]|uniref:DUF4625 domain-containing protein n=1 Tax=Fulvivirga lutea TaxID=2810512 RepID=A0A974WG21_9BACT|nr:hypothetical protein [Fulvivirga lutea]QSE97606.1 hypothetical protein JR347_00525 [Fulvivirga lutea]
MKKLFTLVLISAAFAVSAQNYEAPKEGVNLVVDNPQVVLEKGSSYDFEILMVRSVRAKRAKFEAPRVVGPKAIEFSVEQSAENSDLYTVSVNTANVEAGKYYYLVAAKGKGIHKAKGLSMSFEVTDGNSVASTN